MKKLIFSNIKAVLKSDKFVAILILLGGISIIFLSGYFKDSFAFEINDSSAAKEIVEGQEVADTPSSDEILEDVNACYECGAGDVLGTAKGNCDGTMAIVSDNLCSTGSFELNASESEGLESITDSITIPKNCTLSVFEITYPVYWNGHNKYVNGMTDHRYDIHTGEWPSVSYFVSGGATVSATDGVPNVVGNNFGAVYEAPGISVFGKPIGEDRTGLAYSLDLSGAHDKTHVGETQEFYTPDCDDSAPGSTKIGDKGCASPNFSLEMYNGVISGNKSAFDSVDDVVDDLYPDETPGCSSYSNLKVVIEDKDNSCIDDNGFLGWGGIWDIVIKINDLCVQAGFCEGSTNVRVTLNMQEYSSAARRITIDARNIPGDESPVRYVATPCKVKAECKNELVAAACIWPDYLYYTWQSSELGSSICDPDVNYASVITEDGQPPVRFNFCEYDGGYGYWNYIEYVVKRCNAVINEGKNHISEDELNSCKMMINGSI